MERKELGRIKLARFGYGGYQDAQFGFSIEIEGEAWGVSDFCGTWAKRPSYAEWTEADQAARFATAVTLLRDTLDAAKKRHVAELAGTPVEVTFDGLRMTTWRVLKEVIA